MDRRLQPAVPADHARPARGTQGQLPAESADLEDRLPGCLALWLPAATPREDEGRWLADHFAGRAWLAVELFAGGRDAERLAALEDAGAGRRPAAGSGGRRPYAPPRAPPPAGSGDGNPPGHAAACARTTAVSERRAPPAAPRAARRTLSPELLEAAAGIARRCRFRLDEIRLALSGGARAGRREPVFLAGGNSR
jgi:error-prone DNA polymerase